MFSMSKPVNMGIRTVFFEKQKLSAIHEIYYPKTYANKTKFPNLNGTEKTNPKL